MSLGVNTKLGWSLCIHGCFDKQRPFELLLQIFIKLKWVEMGVLCLSRLTIVGRRLESGSDSSATHFGAYAIENRNTTF